MSAAAVGRYMPAVITLDDLAAMIAADTHGRRYETSPEGVLSVVPPPESDHAVTASQLMFWLISGGWPVEQVMQVVGIRIPGSEVDGGRVPDLAVWSRPQPSAVWLPADDLVLAIEIISSGSEAIDNFVKVAEYAAAGIPHYWTVARDKAKTVTMRRLTPDGDYEVTEQRPQAWLLQASAAGFLPPR